MPDFPSIVGRPPGATITTGSLAAAAGGMQASKSSFSAGAWPSANLAIACPVLVEQPSTIYQLFWENGVLTGTDNADIAVYNQNWTRLVSAGSTALTGASVPQAVNVTDTAIAPGVYFIAMCVDNGTTTIQRSVGFGGVALESLGVMQQAVGAVTLPDPFVPAIPGQAYVPVMGMVLAGATF